ncbi:inorganic phosphate transporter [Sulfobacillus sp. hq2]|uniref:inorganic phosphate transporter n=1 Tax=Sulfobacillus TaxID=28033 RepID=UPI000CD1EE42|nr:inorganic phosphate transporter [Sulfobacillus sp. hq2]MCY0909233.1 inorganic phosphate transporter [Sulfobacillus thermotolerans]POB11520.1 phosphate transporter [Sulfobacillus sp. hq2]
MVLDGAIFTLIVAFTIISGINDGGNLMATFLASRTLRPFTVVPLILISIGLGPMVFGTAVSHTIAVEIINFQVAGYGVLTGALLAALFTLLVTWKMKMPTSTTVALGGGMIGAALVSGHARDIHLLGIVKLLIGLLGSVGLGFLAAWLLTRAIWWILSRLSADRIHQLEKGQYLTAFWQGLAYGANDQEKAIGLMALFFMILHHQTRYHVPIAAIFLPLVFWALGMIFGGIRIARTVGNHVIRVNPMNAVSTQCAAAITVSLAAIAGFPVSTTQTTDGSLFGTGTALRPGSVRWIVVRKILGVWALTLPAAIVLGGGIMALFLWIK